MDFKYIDHLRLLIIIYKDSKNYIRFIHIDNQDKIVEHTLGSPASFSHVLHTFGATEANAEGEPIFITQALDHVYVSLNFTDKNKFYVIEYNHKNKTSRGLGNDQMQC